MHGHRSTEWEKLRHGLFRKSKEIFKRSPLFELPTESSWGEHGEVAASCRDWPTDPRDVVRQDTGMWYVLCCSSLQFSVFCIFVARCEVKHPETHDTHNTCQHHVMKEQCSLACATSAYLERIWILQKPPAKTFSFSTERKTGKDMLQPPKPFYLYHELIWIVRSCILAMITARMAPSTLTCRAKPEPPLWMRFNWLLSLTTRCSPLWSCSPRSPKRLISS